MKGILKEVTFDRLLKFILVVWFVLFTGAFMNNARGRYTFSHNSTLAYVFDTQTGRLYFSHCFPHSALREGNNPVYVDKESGIGVYDLVNMQR